MDEHKICNNCKEDKVITEYSKKYKNKNGEQKYQAICKKCFNKKDIERSSNEEAKNIKSEYDKNYYRKNKEKILKEKKEEYRNKPENKERSNNYAKEYIKNNKEKYYKYRRKNPHIIAWRNILYRTLRYLGTKKEGHTQDMLGYSAIELKEHLQNHFKESMSWENYGEWEIDHIRPLTSFDMDTKPSDVNSLSNLQPLWKEENIAKYNKL